VQQIAQTARPIKQQDDVNAAVPGGTMTCGAPKQAPASTGGCGILMLRMILLRITMNYYGVCI
jgi:hypothetical protein